VKLQAVKAITADSIPEGDPVRKLLDVGTYQTDRNAHIHENIRHELAMMPYVSEFDFISFTLNRAEVILTGWTVRATNRDGWSTPAIAGSSSLYDFSLGSSESRHPSSDGRIRRQQYAQTQQEMMYEEK
jgi:hypothetical protein